MSYQPAITRVAGAVLHFPSFSYQLRIEEFQAVMTRFRSSDHYSPDAGRQDVLTGGRRDFRARRSDGNRAAR